MNLVVRLLIRLDRQKAVFNIALKRSLFPTIGKNGGKTSIAVVAHTKWLLKPVDLEDKIFRNINMKGFSVDEKDQAVEFLKNA